MDFKEKAYDFVPLAEQQSYNKTADILMQKSIVKQKYI